MVRTRRYLAALALVLVLGGFAACTPLQQYQRSVTTLFTAHATVAVAPAP